MKAYGILVAVLIAMAGGASAADFSDLQTFKVSDVKASTGGVVERYGGPGGNQGVHQYPGLYQSTEMKIVEFESKGYVSPTEAYDAMDLALGQLQRARYTLVEKYFSTSRAGYTLRFRAPALGSLREYTSEAFDSRKECEQAAEASTMMLMSQRMVILERRTQLSSFSFNYSYFIAYFNPYF
jgi:hypothetical protein